MNPTSQMPVISPRDQIELWRLRTYSTSPQVGQQVWRSLSDKDRLLAGGSFEEAFELHSSIGILCKARGLSPGRAIIEIARGCGLISQFTAEGLIRGIGECPDSRIPSEVPHWDVDSGELAWRGEVVCQVRVMRIPSNQQTILDALEKAGWASAIASPFDEGSKTSQAIYQAIRELNKKVRGISFHCDAGARRILWKPVVANSKSVPSEVK